MNKKCTLNNRKGMSLIEVMIAAGLLALISLGVGTMLQNVSKEQKQNNLLVTLRELKIKFSNVIQDRKAWNYTMLASTNGMTCLTANPPIACTAVTSSTPNNLGQVMDSTNTIFYSGVNWATPTGGNGFTETGANCTGFVATAGGGNNACPIGFKMAWEPVCPATGSCINPSVRVTIRAIYNPAPENSAGKFVNTLAVTDVNTATAPGKYDYQLVRAANGLTKTFTLVHTDPSGAAGGGTCGSSRPYTETTDAYNLVTISGTSFTVEPGVYNCALSAVGYASGGFTARVRNITAGTIVAASNNLAPRWTQAPVNFNFNINITSATVFQVDQTCEYAPGSGQDAFALGFSSVASFGAGAQTFSTLICTAID